TKCKPAWQSPARSLIRGTTLSAAGTSPREVPAESKDPYPATAAESLRLATTTSPFTSSVPPETSRKGYAYTPKRNAPHRPPEAGTQRRLSQPHRTRRNSHTLSS